MHKLADSTQDTYKTRHHMLTVSLLELFHLHDHKKNLGTNLHIIIEIMKRLKTVFML